MLNVKWALRSACCFPTDLTDFHRFLTPCGVFCCEARCKPLLVREYLCKSVRSVGDFSFILTPHGVFAVNHSENRCVQRRESVQICEICGRLFLNHNAKIQHFIFPTHRCSSLLTDIHRFSPINIRVLPNGRKYRILAGD